ncbi:MAG: hypothetical protein Q7S27_02400 [Nanoarchaeota archaeon]|nr:hypothetical protein [Nanoarchaeota archaeon]
MEKKQKVVIALLIIAILFSIVSIVINLAGDNLKLSAYNNEKSSNNNGNVQLIVEPNSETNGEEK